MEGLELTSSAIVMGSNIYADPGPLHLSHLQASGAMVDFDLWAKLALGIGSDNDRPPMRVVDPDELQALFGEFQVLAPHWAEEGLLLP